MCFILEGTWLYLPENGPRYGSNVYIHFVKYCNVVHDFFRVFKGMESLSFDRHAGVDEVGSCDRRSFCVSPGR